MTIGERLKKLRTKKSFSVAHVADALGVAQSTYREWEYGRKISGEPYQKLAEVFGVSVLEILGLERTNRDEIVDDLDAIIERAQDIKKKLMSFSLNETKTLSGGKSSHELGKDF